MFTLRVHSNRSFALTRDNETALIESHNNKATSFTLAHNDYSDLTFSEFRERFHLHVKADIRKTKFNFAPKKEQAQNKLRQDASTSISRRLDSDEGVDWAALGLLGPIRNQGLCGACWAFSAIGSIESAMAIAKFNQMTPSEQLVGGQLGLVVPLSEQNLIDCDVMNQQGCDGGL